MIKTLTLNVSHPYTGSPQVGFTVSLYNLIQDKLLSSINKIDTSKSGLTITTANSELGYQFNSDYGQWSGLSLRLDKTHNRILSPTNIWVEISMSDIFIPSENRYYLKVWYIELEYGIIISKITYGVDDRPYPKFPGSKVFYISPDDTGFIIMGDLKSSITNATHLFEYRGTFGLNSGELNLMKHQAGPHTSETVYHFVTKDVSVPYNALINISPIGMCARLNSNHVALIGNVS